MGLVACAGKLHLPATPAQGGVHEFRQVHLGMEVRLVIAHADARTAERLADSGFARIAALEAVLSDWRPTSELRRLEDAPTGEWVPVSAPLRDVLGLALEVARATDGGFDPTVGALTALWRESARSGRPIDDSARVAARARIGYQRIVLDSAGGRLRSSIPRLRLDLGAIAKGWILDQVVEAMRDSVEGVLAEAGGDIVVAGHPGGASGWRIAVRTPAGDSIVTLTDGAVSTSGPVAQRVDDAAGRPEGHVFDPRTGRGALLATTVTVIARRGAVSDAVATALTLVPNEKRAALAARFGVTIVGGAP